MFKIGLGGCLAALLEFVKVILHLFGIQFRWQALKVQRNSCYMTTVIIKSAGRTTQDRNITFKALQQFMKSCNFTAGTIEVLIPSQFFRRPACRRGRFFFVVIILMFCWVTNLRIVRKASVGLVQQGFGVMAGEVLRMKLIANFEL